MNVGQARVIFVTGFHTPPDTWKSLDLDQGWQANAGSIVARVDYGGKSILLTGDAVGRRKSSVDASECLATEKLMVDNADDVSIRADVIVAPHHGANNASSTCLIQAVQPGWVIFSAGHDHQHPTEAAGERYLDAGVSETNIFRTDRGDYESGFYHWQDGTTGMVDLPRDDDVEVFISPSGDVCVQYRGSGQCP